MLPSPRSVWRDTDFFNDGGSKTKYLLVLAVEGGDITYRNLTKQGKGRTTDPRCSHVPFDGFFLGAGVLPELWRPTWIDIDDSDDYDDLWWNQQPKARFQPIGELPPDLFCAALRCFLKSNCPLRGQHRKVGDLAARLGCR